MELILQNPSLPLLFPLSTQNMDHKEMSCTLHSTFAMSAFTYPHICSPHIFHGQGQCPGKSSHSSDSSPGGRNQVWELDMNLMIFTAHTHFELLLMCENPPRLWLSRWDIQGGWMQSDERGSLGSSRKPNRRERNQIPQLLGGSKLERACLTDIADLAWGESIW